MPSIFTSPYDTAETVLIAARVHCGDAGGPLGTAGNILNDAQPYVFPMLFERYRYLQDRLITGGVETFKKYGFVIGIPPVPSNANRSVFMKLTYTGFDNGQTIIAPPFLPVDCLKPLELWERQNGGSTWVPMRQASDSISTRPFTSRFCIWDYANDELIIPGASQTNDLKIKYLCYAPDITGPNSPIMVAHATTALSFLMAAEASKSRGGQAAAGFMADAEDAILKIMNRSAIKDAFKSSQRKPFRNRGGRH